MLLRLQLAQRHKAAAINRSWPLLLLLLETPFSAVSHPPASPFLLVHCTQSLLRYLKLHTLHLTEFACCLNFGSPFILSWHGCCCFSLPPFFFFFSLPSLVLLFCRGTFSKIRHPPNPPTNSRNWLHSILPLSLERARRGQISRHIPGTFSGWDEVATVSLCLSLCVSFSA